MTYLLENINTTIAKIAECMARDPKRAERLLGDVKKLSAEAEREAYARGKAAGIEQAASVCDSRAGDGKYSHEREASDCADAIRSIVPEN